MRTVVRCSDGGEDNGVYGQEDGGLNKVMKTGRPVEEQAAAVEERDVPVEEQAGARGEASCGVQRRRR